MKLMQAGLPRPLGAACSSSGVNFAIYSSHATRIELCLFDSVSGAQQECFDLPARTGNVWHGLLSASQAGPGTHYGFRVHGTATLDQGYRYDSELVLIDPYALELSTAQRPLARVVDRSFDWGNDRPPRTAWRDMVIYELHVKGFTKLHPAVPDAWRGKYLGLTVPAVIEHIKSLGVTSVELLPCQAFLSEPFLRERGLENYWGYNSAAWFAPANEFALADAVREFKTMVKALHAAGLEVVLDVVFNHTAEGNESGPVLNFKGIDNPVYYRLQNDRRFYDNATGCGNTVNCAHPEVRALIIECLKYWVEDMHVDGFRFDLATVLAREDHGYNEHSQFFKSLSAEPALAHVKLIAEPWDVGWGGYQLGRFPPGWAEWNDRYRDTVRSFWRRDPGKLGELAERVAGSSDIFRHNGRRPTASINFITAHDGFTLHDLVTYNQRHNEANKENNADGTGNNTSWNCGIEGPTDDAAIVALRGRQMRNFLATLFLSLGVPMLQAGDEFGRTQHGNNNAYCQDNEISWIDWERARTNAALIDFVRRLSVIRRTHAEFRRETFLRGTLSRSAVKDVTWLNVRGCELTQGEWQDAAQRTLGVWFAKRSNSAGRLLLLLNAAESAQEFLLPSSPSQGPWACLFDTARDAAAAVIAQTYSMASNSAVLLEC